MKKVKYNELEMKRWGEINDFKHQRNHSKL